MNMATLCKQSVSEPANQSEFKLLVGVSVDRSPAVLSIFYGSKALIEDISTMGVEAALWPSEMPTEQGLYIFTGCSQLETLGDATTDSLRAIFHHASYQRVGSVT